MHFHDHLPHHRWDKQICKNAEKNYSSPQYVKIRRKNHSKTSEKLKDCKEIRNSYKKGEAGEPPYGIEYSISSRKKDHEKTIEHELV